jgi:hypothetical protein
MLGRRRTRYPSLYACVPSLAQMKAASTTRRNKPRARPGRRLVRPPSLWCRRRRPRLMSMGFPCPHHRGRPMCDSAHDDGPREFKSD